MKIRPYTDQDYPSIEAILKANKMHDEVWDHRDNLASMISRDPESVLVAEIDGEIVGNVIITDYGNNVSYLFRLSVKDSYKKQGVGTLLLKEAEALLKKRGTKEIALVVHAERDDLKAYYEKRGYSTSGNKFIYMIKNV